MDRVEVDGWVLCRRRGGSYTMVVAEFQAKLLAYRLGVKTSETKMTNPFGCPSLLG
jgi:hypothetical protein